MASYTTLFSAALAFLSAASAAPVQKRTSCNTLSSVVNASAPIQLYTVPRTAATDMDGCGITQQIDASPATFFSIQQPDEPASDGERYLFSSDSPNDAIFEIFRGGYIEASLPIPKSDPPANATWSSVNQPLFPIGSAEGGIVSFTTANEGADGGLAISGISGAIYLRNEASPDLEPNYAIWKSCSNSTINPNGSYLAFNGTDTADCEDVYLIGCNNGVCPTS